MSVFSVERALRFGQCDPSGIAYFPAYLDILNSVVEDFWADIGFPWRKLILENQIGTPTVHLECDFKRPSIFGDLLTFDLVVRRVGRASLQLDHTVSSSDGIRWQAHQTLVATSTATHRSMPWPDAIRARLEARRVSAATIAEPSAAL